MKKKELRKIYLQKRLELSPEAYQDLNEKLLCQFQKLDLEKIRCIHFFLPIQQRREPDTWMMINWLKHNHPSIRLSYPKADFATNQMQHFLDDEALKIANNGFGIPEPIAGNEIEPSEIDMLLVPLLAFDKRGYRVGYGKGFYDRFMGDCKPGGVFIGVTFFGPVDLIDDINAFDIPLHRCITPQKVWEFKG